MNVQASHHPPLAVLNITPHAFYLLVFVFVFQPRAFAQNDSLAGFDQEQAITHASYANSEVQKERVLRATERQFIKQKFFSPLKPAKHEEVISVEETLANCDNIGFENGSVAGWTVKGDYVVTAVGNDGFGGFPRVFPGGKHSLQLNNNTIVDKTNFDASASKLFRVTPGNTSLNLHFAMVILNYPHDSYSAARFNITLRDCTNHVDLCSRFSCYYDAGIGPVGASNFSVSAKKGENTGHETFDVTYAPWQTIGIDLSPHTGKDIAVQISCNWCIPRVDWAYCYIDADCGTATVKQFPCRKMPSSLSGPPGFQTYK